MTDILERLSDPEFKAEFGAASAKSDLAIALALARHAAGLTQAAMADLIGAKQSYIAKLEGGEANPTIGSIGRILAKMDRRLVVSTGLLVDTDVVQSDALSEPLRSQTADYPLDSAVLTYMPGGAPRWYAEDPGTNLRSPLPSTTQDNTITRPRPVEVA